MSVIVFMCGSGVVLEGAEFTTVTPGYDVHVEQSGYWLTGYNAPCDQCGRRMGLYICGMLLTSDDGVGRARQVSTHMQC